jgi:hypothetical protein
VEFTAKVMKFFSFFSSAQTTEILGGFRCILVELEDESSGAHSIDVDIHEAMGEWLSTVGFLHFL